MKKELVLSCLGHTWILDIDGTIVKHNGYKDDGVDSFLNGALDFLRSIPKTDMIIFVTSRDESFRQETETFFKSHDIRYDYIIFNAPYGERILINDNKPSGLRTGISLNLIRDEGIDYRIIEDEKL